MIVPSLFTESLFNAAIFVVISPFERFSTTAVITPLFVTLPSFVSLVSSFELLVNLAPLLLVTSPVIVPLCTKVPSFVTSPSTVELFVNLALLLFVKPSETLILELLTKVPSLTTDF